MTAAISSGERSSEISNWPVARRVDHSLAPGVSSTLRPRSVSWSFSFPAPV